MSDLFKLGLEIATGSKQAETASAPASASASTTTASAPSPPTPSSTPQTVPALTKELLLTERTYISRLHALKETYADPLRSNSLDSTKSITILEASDTLVLFSNIDDLVPLNEAFIADVWAVSSGLSDEKIGDVVGKHFSAKKFQEEYTTYFISFQGIMKKYDEVIVSRSQFAPFLKVADNKIPGLPNVTLKDLLKDPVVRLARYTLLFKALLAAMDEDDAQREQLEAATEVVWKIVGGRPEKKA